jgi:hypothetical protein
LGRCSACGEILSEGANRCPACELPITAVAVPEPKKSTWWLWVLLVIGSMWAMGTSMRALERWASESRHERFRKELSGGSFNRRILEQRCGSGLAKRVAYDDGTAAYLVSYPQLTVLIEGTPVELEKDTPSHVFFMTRQRMISSDEAIDLFPCLLGG